MKTIVCFHPSGYSRLGLLESSGGRRRILPSLTPWDMLRREKFMVCREGRAKEREAREEPAGFTGESLRGIRNRHVRRPQKWWKEWAVWCLQPPGLRGWESKLGAKYPQSKDTVGGQKNFGLVILSSESLCNPGWQQSCALFPLSLLCFISLCLSCHLSTASIHI